MDSNVRAAQYIAGAIVAAGFIISLGIGGLGDKIASTLISVNSQNRFEVKQDRMEAAKAGLPKPVE